MATLSSLVNRRAKCVRLVVYFYVVLLILFLSFPTRAQTTPSSPNARTLVGDFEGSLDPDLTDTYECQGYFSYIAVPTANDPANKALSIFLDPTKPRKNCVGGTRAEVSEAIPLRLPIRTEIWYGFRFLFPPGMKGQIRNRHFVLAQLKQRDESPCSPNALDMNLLTESDGNPIISIRLSEDLVSGLVAVELSVSSQNVGKISAGSVLMKPEVFFGNWHTLLIHTYVDPRLEGDRDPNKKGFVESFLDTEAFRSEPYGMENGAPSWDEPFGYTAEVGCDYFKFGIYGDPAAPAWNIIVDRFRRGSSRQDVEPSP